MALSDGVPARGKGFMQATATRLIHEEITKKIIGCVYYIHSQLGHGFLEKVYENALAHQLRKLGLKVDQQIPLKVIFDDTIVGEYVADMVVEEKVLLEIKAVSSVIRAHEVQLVNYLKATGIKVGLLINFGEQVSITRRVFDARNL